MSNREFCANFFVMIGLAGLFGGFASCIWLILFGGPSWAAYWAIFGLPITFVSVGIADEISPTEKKP